MSRAGYAKADLLCLYLIGVRLVLPRSFELLCCSDRGVTRPLGQLLASHAFADGDQGPPVPSPGAAAGLEPLDEGAGTRLVERLYLWPEGTDPQRRRPPPLRRVLVLLARTLGRNMSVRWSCLETQSSTGKS